MRAFDWQKGTSCKCTASRHKCSISQYHLLLLIQNMQIVETFEMRFLQKRKGRTRKTSTKESSATLDNSEKQKKIRQSQRCNCYVEPKFLFSVFMVELNMISWFGSMKAALECLSQQEVYGWCLTRPQQRINPRFQKNNEQINRENIPVVTPGELFLLHFAFPKHCRALMSVGGAALSSGSKRHWLSLRLDIAFSRCQSTFPFAYRQR